MQIHTQVGRCKVNEHPWHMARVHTGSNQILLCYHTNLPFHV